MQTRVVVVTTVVAGVLLFGAGLLIGHFAIKNKGDDDDAGVAGDAEDTGGPMPTSDGCANGGLPRTYIAYHLNGQTVNIDGQLDDPAWQEVPWTETFMGRYLHATTFVHKCLRCL